MTEAPTRVAIAARLLPFTAWLLAAAVLAQSLLAGLGTFAGAGWWARHTMFVHTFEWLTIVLVILAYVARAPRGTKGFAWLTVVLLFVQYATAGFRGVAGRAGLAAVHPVGAALLFWVAMELARRARVSRSSREASTRPT